MAITLFHQTRPEAAKQILANGFRDSTGRYMMDHEFTGVFFTDSPDGADDQASAAAGATVMLQVDLLCDWADIADDELVEEGKPYREWILPAKFVNAGKISFLRED